MTFHSRGLGEALLERRVLSRDDLEEFLVRERNEGIPLAKLMLADGKVSERDLAAAVAQAAGVDFIDLSTEAPSPTVDGFIPAEVARRHQAVAVDVTADALRVAMADPTDAVALAEIAEAAGIPIKGVMAARSDIARALNALYPGTAPVASPAPAPSPDEQLHLDELLVRVVEMGGSDLHLSAGMRPAVRVSGKVSPMADTPILKPAVIQRMVYAVLTQKQRERFEEQRELDTSHSVPGLGRFRMNVFLQRNSVGSVLRVIPHEIQSLESLGLPPAVAAFAELPRGLVIVTGPTGSGKSTTLASLIDIINRDKPMHIMTVEDPIEFLHEHKRSIVNQREVGEDTQSFGQALKHVLRQDPDVILVGEMRDLETISTAITAAETGHLVFGTLHTQDAPQSVDRIIDVFPPHQQQQIRVQLAAALQGVVTQQLVPLASGPGRAAVAEVMVVTPAIRNLIREGKTHQLYSAMQAGGKYGMVTMDMSLAALVRSGRVTMAVARERCANEEDLRRLVAGN